MSDEDFKIIQDQLAVLAGSVKAVNENVMNINRALFGDAEPSPYDRLGEFGHTIGARSKGINDVLEKMIETFERGGMNA